MKQQVSGTLNQCDASDLTVHSLRTRVELFASTSEGSVEKYSPGKAKAGEERQRREVTADIEPWGGDARGGKGDKVMGKPKVSGPLRNLQPGSRACPWVSGDAGAEEGTQTYCRVRLAKGV
ncbi:hypothetical protein O3P69_000715 [Scylla paramamosain]|uniref:Uncharacterized protein n=1 Tax=Scylla paramamosain TaxID=85552 RepID=A0AAW0UQS4_SCYPA